MIHSTSLLLFLAAFVFAPLFVGVINRTKAWFGGRRGQPLLQVYYDIIKLLAKGSVYSHTTTRLFRLAPIMAIAIPAMVACMMPSATVPALLPFTGDFLVVVYLLAAFRFSLVLAALDTGSSFEGMGASRELWFSFFAELALMFGFIALVMKTGTMSLTGIYSSLSLTTWAAAKPIAGLVTAVFVLVFLAENARVPVDDPNTHLELTMIHEVMILDHSGPDLGYLLYGAALKMWLTGALLVGVVVPVHTGCSVLDGVIFLASMGVLAMVVGIIESTMARLRMIKVPYLLLMAIALALFAIMLELK